PRGEDQPCNNKDVKIADACALPSLIMARDVSICPSLATEMRAWARHSCLAHASKTKAGAKPPAVYFLSPPDFLSAGFFSAPAAAPSAAPAAPSAAVSSSLAFLTFLTT